jgi:hypothetical protein
MAARKFFYICAGLFLLAMSYHLGASAAGAAAPVAQPSETAMLSGVIHSGQTIPLPVYSDGTTALESECAWTVSPAFYSGSDNWCYTADAFIVGEPAAYVDHDNTAFYNAHRGRVVNAGGGAGWPLDANYIIIATRGASQPTPTLQQSWGQLKSRYAPSHTPTSQTPTNR